MREYLSLIMKVTSKCTLACSYCQYIPLSSSDNGNLFMNRDVLYKSISEIMSLHLKRITFIWHGGEPLLVGKSFYEDAIDFQKKNQKQHQQIVNNIQTNATILNKEWIDFFQKNNFNISISIDGPPEIHNRHRINLSTKGSFAKVMRSVDLLKAENVKFGSLSVVTKDSANNAKEIYNFFKTNDFKYFDFLPCIELRRNTGKIIGASITPYKFADFMTQIFDLWIKDDNPNIHIRYFDNILTNFLGGKSTLCKFTGNCGSFLTINYNGDVYPCDNFIGYSDLKFGNIVVDELKTILESEKYNTFLDRVNAINSDCTGCEWYHICKGGCPFFSFIFNQDFSDRNYLCEARKRIFKHVEGKIKGIIYAF